MGQESSSSFLALAEAVQTKGELADCVWQAKLDLDQLASEISQAVFQHRVPQWVAQGEWDLSSRSEGLKLKSSFQQALTLIIEPAWEKRTDRNEPVDQEQWKAAKKMFEDLSLHTFIKKDFFKAVSPFLDHEGKVTVEHLANANLEIFSEAGHAAYLFGKKIP
jgi:hypothetical protein